MGSSSAISPAGDPGFLAHFTRRLAGRTAMPFAEFMALALYDPEVGYYRQQRPRVGTTAGTDFYTASSCGPVFGELVAAACVALLPGRDPADYAFVELGAEAHGGILHAVQHPFREVRTIRVGEPLSLAGHCIVFSNELLDAQPFRRWIRQPGEWRDRDVGLRGNQLVELDGAPVDYPDLPDSPTGYRIDAPLAAADLTRQIASEPWDGLFLAIDYGKTWQDLAHHTPTGTARAYFRHTQTNDLLGRPGQQDLTCHICWDWIRRQLQDAGFQDLTLEAQETFLVRQAAPSIQAIVTSEPALSSRRRALQQLLHPGNLGRKFQVLHGWRERKNHLASSPARSLPLTL